MQRRLRQVLAPIPWGVDKMAAALVSPASCGQSRRGMLHRTARRCSQDSLQKAAMSIRPYEARLSTGPSPLGPVGSKGRGQSWSYREFFIYVVVCGLWQRTLWGEPDKTYEYPDCRTEESALLRKSEALSESMFPQLETRLCLPASTGLLSSMLESPVSCGSRHPEARPCGPWSSR